MASTIWRGHLSFGLVSFPVRLFRAARPEKVSFRRLYRPAAEPSPEAIPAPAPPSPRAAEKKAGPPPEPPVETRNPEPRNREPRSAEPPPAPVFRTHNTITTSGDQEEPVSRSNLVKGYEYEKGQYVVLEDQELRSLEPETSKELQIIEFVEVSAIDPIFFETSYYLSPDAPGERPYSLLFEALRGTGYAGLGQLAMHRREHIVIVRPGRRGMIAHTMFYPDEVQQAQEYPADTSALNPRELELAKKLVETLVVPFEPQKFRDTYRERLQQVIAERVEGRRVSHEPAAATRTAPVIDIMHALEQSLNMAKKPPAAAPATARKGRSRRAG